MAEEARWQEHGAAAHTVSAVRTRREGCWCSAHLSFLEKLLFITLCGWGRERGEEGGGGRERCLVMGPRIAAHMLRSEASCVESVLSYL